MKGIYRTLYSFNDFELFLFHSNEKIGKQTDVHLPISDIRNVVRVYPLLFEQRNELNSVCRDTNKSLVGQPKLRYNNQCQ